MGILSLVINEMLETRRASLLSALYQGVAQPSAQSSSLQLPLIWDCFILPLLHSVSAV